MSVLVSDTGFCLAIFFERSSLVRQGGPLLPINRPGGNELDQKHKEDRRMERNLATWRRCRKVRLSGSSVNRFCFWVLEPHLVDRGYGDQILDDGCLKLRCVLTSK